MKNKLFGVMLALLMAACLACAKEEPLPEKVTNVPGYQQNMKFYSGIELGYDLNRFGSFFSGRQPHSVQYILNKCPTELTGGNERGNNYLIYDVSEGYRVFIVTVRPLRGNETARGYPLLVGYSLLPHRAFSSLKVGDLVEKVIDIDPIAKVYRDRFIYVFGERPRPILASEESFVPTTSVHYLSDGILKIEYDLLEDGSMRIASIEFGENHFLVNYSGETVDYLIDPADLPKLQ